MSPADALFFSCAFLFSIEFFLGSTSLCTPTDSATFAPLLTVVAALAGYASPASAGKRLGKPPARGSLLKAPFVYSFTRICLDKNIRFEAYSRSP